MPFLQTLLPWLTAHLLAVIVVVCLLTVSYVVAKATFQRRVLPARFEKRVESVILKGESGIRSASGSRSSASISRIGSTQRPVAKPEDKR